MDDKMKKYKVKRANLYRKTDLARNFPSLAVWRKLKVERSIASSLAKKEIRLAIAIGC